ncbi:putative ATPase family AAA domain-containing protein 1 [Apostichopus japonicus]|uniref:Putative ATPase family AAA domain-containing protein 1 n=1 Tax=Stichopus japonicus TaxID=307972 RepID=A0A2G8L2U0_STIJA|nr:putative ATPase family AAA domain-containing protein 1 [Apostichopus japonicus]
MSDNVSRFNGLSHWFKDHKDIFDLAFRLGLVGVVTYFGVKWLAEALDPTQKQKKEAKKQSSSSEYELSIASQLIVPSSLDVTWDDIGGLTDVCQEIRDTVIYPLKNRELYRNSDLIGPPKGVLLYGPPGCGKTMLAKAIATDAGCRFINLQASGLTDKWYGESQKLASAVFSLAKKLHPTIIFIDEIDSFLRSRGSSDHEATAMMKAQFMTLWDGLISDKDTQIMVMGATNRPQDVDAAILRRMPTTFHIPKPVSHKNTRSLTTISKLVAENVNLDAIAKDTKDYSGSDLKELCRNACMVTVKDHIREFPTSSGAAKPLRAVEMKDMQLAVHIMDRMKNILSPLAINSLPLD